MRYAIEVRGLTKSYRGKTAVNGLDLTVKEGTVFGLLGANGAGKSTVIECILGTRRRDSGSVSILGMDPVSYTHLSRPGRIGTASILI